jgi:hypothetical protein
VLQRTVAWPRRPCLAPHERVRVIKRPRGPKTFRHAAVPRPLPLLGLAGRPHLHQTRTLRLNGNVERSHRIDAEEFLGLCYGTAW